MIYQMSNQNSELNLLFFASSSLILILTNLIFKGTLPNEILILFFCQSVHFGPTRDKEYRLSITVPFSVALLSSLNFLWKIITWGSCCLGVYSKTTPLAGQSRLDNRHTGLCPLRSVNLQHHHRLIISVSGKVVPLAHSPFIGRNDWCIQIKKN